MFLHDQARHQLASLEIVIPSNSLLVASGLCQAPSPDTTNNELPAITASSGQPLLHQIRGLQLSSCRNNCFQNILKLHGARHTHSAASLAPGSLMTL